MTSLNRSAKDNVYSITNGWDDPPAKDSDTKLRCGKSLPDLLPSKAVDTGREKQPETTSAKSLKTLRKSFSDFPLPGKPQIAFGTKVPPRTIHSSVQRRFRKSQSCPEKGLSPEIGKESPVEFGSEINLHSATQSRNSSTFTIYTEDSRITDEFSFSR